jgi:hypothetical protein
MCRPLGGALVGHHQVRSSHANRNNLFLDGIVWHGSDDHHVVLLCVGTFKF